MQIVVRMLIIWFVLSVVALFLAGKDTNSIMLIFSCGCVTLLFGDIAGGGDELTITQKTNAAVARYGWHQPQVDPAQKLAEDTFPTDRKSD